MMSQKYMYNYDLLTIAKKKNDKIAKPVKASANSMTVDSVSGIRRSNLAIIVLSANNPKAAETRRSRFVLAFLYAINDNTMRKAANIPLAKSTISEGSIGSPSSSICMKALASDSKIS
jgi:hypothetical protein